MDKPQYKMLFRDKQYTPGDIEISTTDLLWTPPKELEPIIQDRWEKHSKRRSLWNGLLYTVNAYTLSSERLSLTLGLSDFKANIGVSRNKDLKSFFDNSEFFPPCHSGLALHLVTKDGYLVLGNRKHVSLQHDMSPVLISGGLNKDEMEIHAGADLFEHAYKELHEELGVTKDDVDPIILIAWIEYLTSFNTFIFEVNLKLSKDELQKRFEVHGDDENASLIFVKDNKSDAQDFYRQYSHAMLDGSKAWLYEHYVASSGKIHEQIPLAPYTTFNIGGEATYFTEATTTDDVHNALEFAHKQKLDIFVLGGGSNVVISDDGFDGLVIQNHIHGISHNINDGAVTVTVGAGMEWDAFVQHCVKQEWWGIENLSGIPGLVGAVPVQNINAYGQHAHEVVTKVHTIELATGKERVFSNEECEFGYRKSAFNTHLRNTYFITAITFRLVRDGKPNYTYEYIERVFKEKNIAPTIQDMRDAVLAQRKKRSMLKGLYHNTGSFYKNSAIVPEAQFKDIYETIIEGRDRVPMNCCSDPFFWKLPDGNIKIASGCLVHFLNILPGTREGNVGTCPDQTLALTNFNNATADELLRFAKKIRKKVYDAFGVVLDFEPDLVGFTKEQIEDYLSLET